MSESKSHKSLQIRLLGNPVRLRKNFLLASASMPRLQVAERPRLNGAGKPNSWNWLQKDYKESRANQRVLPVPNSDIPKAVEAMKKVGVGGTVKNLSGTNRRYVPKQ